MRSSAVFRGKEVLPAPGDEGGGQFALSPLLDVKIADDGKDGGADEVDEEVLHGVPDTHIQIAAQAEGLLGTVGVDDDDVSDVLNDDRGGPALQRRWCS